MKQAPVVGRIRGDIWFAVPLSAEEWTALHEKPDVVDWLALPTMGPDGLTVVIVATPDPEHFGWERR